MYKIVLLWSYILYGNGKVDAKNYFVPTSFNPGSIQLSPIDCYEGSGNFSKNFTTCTTEGRCVKIISLSEDGKPDHEYEEHRCEREEEEEDFKAACAWLGQCDQITLRGKNYNVCCCSDRNLCNSGHQFLPSVFFILLAALWNTR